MPYKSEAQRGYMHAAAERGDIDPKVVEEFDEASRGQRGLPYHVKKKKRPVHKAVVLVPLEKGRTYHSAAQGAMDFDGDAHPREAKGIHDDKYKPGEFIPKEKAAKPADPVSTKEPWQMTRMEFLRSRPLPTPTPVPMVGHFPAVTTDDGNIYVDTSRPSHGTHVRFIEAAGIPPERVTGGGFITDGEYEDYGARSDAGRNAEIAQSSQRTKHKYAVMRAIEEGKPVPPEVRKQYPEFADRKPMGKSFLVLLEKGQESFDFDEDLHPRAPKGGPHGGEFVKKDEVEKFPVQYRRHGHPTPETRLVTVPPNADPERKPPAPVGGEIIEARGKKEADRINAALYNAYGYHAKIVHQHGGYILKDTGLDAETAHDLMFLLGTSIASKKVTQELIEGARAQRIAQAAENARQYDEMLAAREANAGRFAYKKEAPADDRPTHVFHDDYTGPRWTYAPRLRPPSHANIPKGHIIDSQRADPNYPRFGVVDYPRQLTPEEVRGYELDPVLPEGTVDPKQAFEAPGEAVKEFLAHTGTMSPEEKAAIYAVRDAFVSNRRAGDFAAFRDWLEQHRGTNDYADAIAGNLGDPIKKAFPVLKTAPLPEDTAHAAQGGPPPAKPFLIPHAKRPRRRVPNRQGGGGAVLNEEETDRTNLVLDPPVLIPFEGTLLDKDLGL